MRWKAKFPPPDWARARLLPASMFYLVAGVDGNMDAKEWAQFTAELDACEELPEGVYREVMVDLNRRWEESTIEEAVSACDHLEDLKAILSSRLDGPAYADLVLNVYDLGWRVAQASGGFLGFGSKVSGPERHILLQFAEMFGIDPETLEVS